MGGRPEASAFLERESIMDAAHGALADAAAGTGSVLAFEGEAGVGKTRVLTELLTAQELSDWTVLTARGGELEQDFAFGVVRQLFERHVALLSPARRAEALTGAARHAVSVLSDPEPPSPASGSRVYAALNGLYWLTYNLADERPLLLLADDVHWSDSASLRWIDFLARRIEDMPLTLVLAFRPQIPSALHGLLANPVVQRQVVRPLSPDGTEAIVRSQLGAAADDVVEACHTATGGNPFLISELTTALAGDSQASARDIAARAPHGVKVSLRARLAPLGADAERVLGAAALLGASAELRHVAALAGIDTPAASELMGQLVGIDLLEASDRISFRHPLLRAAAYETLSAPQRAMEHGRAAELLLAEERPLDAATHLLRSNARADPRVVGTLRFAAGDAVGRGAPDAAVQYLRRALAEPPTPAETASVMRELGTAEMLVQDPAAAEHLAVAFNAETEPRLRVIAGRLLSTAYIFGTRFQDAAALTAQMLAMIPEDETDLRVAVLAERLFVATIFAGLVDPEPVYDELMAHCAAVPEGSETANELSALAACTTYTSRALLPVANAIPIGRRAFAGGRLFDGQPTETPILVGPMVTLMIAGCYDEALKRLRRRPGRRSGPELGLRFRPLVCLARRMLRAQGRSAPR